MGREKHEMDATRMVVEVDGRWDPTAIYKRIKSARLPIQGVKLGDCGRCILSFGEPLTSEALFMMQREIISFFARSPSETENRGQAPQKKPAHGRIKKGSYVNRRI